MFWVPGHFPEYAVMPGVLIVEALAQAGAVALLSLPENTGKLAFFAGIDKVRFKRQVVPGDTLYGVAKKYGLSAETIMSPMSRR